MEELMTGSECARAMRQVADAIEHHPAMPMLRPKDGPMDADCQLGAAAMLCFLRDALTVSPKDHWGRGELLVLLNSLQTDSEIFTIDLVSIFEA